MSPNAKFLLRFFAALVVVYVLIALGPVNDAVIEPFTEWVARVSTLLLRAIGQPAEVDGTIVRAGFAVDINNGCNGVEAMMLLIAAIFAFPASATSRLLGIVGGSLAVQGLNFVRIVTLFLLGKYHPSVFQLFHTAVWQIVIILVSLAVFFVWSWKFAAAKPLESTT